MRDKKRIFICGTLPPPNYGPSFMFEMLLGTEFVNAFEVIFLDVKFFSYGTMDKINAKKILLFCRYLLKYAFIILTRKPDYILYPISFHKMPFLKDLLFVAVGRIFGCRIVQYDLGQYLRDLYSASNAFYRWLIVWLLRNIDASIVMGENTKKLYKGFYDVGKVFVVPGAVEDSVNLSVPITKKMSISDRSLRVLFFSLLAASKGLWTALNAIIKVKQFNCNVRFIFAGAFESEKTKQEVFRYVREHKIEDNFEYTGYIADRIVRTNLFRSSDIFIFPTQRDVFGLVILHAMAESLPVIASLEGNIPEIITDGENGYLIDKGNSEALAEKIILLANDMQLRKKIGEQNRLKYISMYTPEKYGKNILNTFERIEKIGRIS